MPLHKAGARAGIPTVAPASKFDKDLKVQRSTFASIKKDKRRIKHSSFVSRIEKSVPKTKKRRRPSKKLVTNLESLVDALPDLDCSHQKTSSHSSSAVTRQMSLKSRPGAMKKKANLEKLERERFARNMAQLADRPTTTGGHDASAETLRPRESTNSWHALRKFIMSTFDGEATK